MGLIHHQEVLLTFGDSLTQTWEEGSLNQRLSYSYCRKFDVVNRGFGGYNTEWALPILEQTFSETPDQGAPVRLMTIWFGANDACLPPSPQHIPIPTFQANLAKMISLVRERSPSTSIILITPPPISAAMRAAQISPRELDRTEATTHDYARAVLDVGEKEGVPTLDLWQAVVSAVGGEDKVGTVLRDGLHLNKEGYQILYDSLIPLIQEHYPSLDPAKLSPTWPFWNDIDLKNPHKSVFAVGLPEKRPAKDEL